MLCVTGVWLSKTRIKKTIRDGRLKKVKKVNQEIIWREKAVETKKNKNNNLRTSEQKVVLTITVIWIFI